MSQILIIEQSLTGSTLASFPMDLGMSRTTLRELIRRRVYEEVVELRAAGRCPLVAPGDVEAALNEPRPSTRRVDWEVAAPGWIFEPKEDSRISKGEGDAAAALIGMGV